MANDEMRAVVVTGCSTGIGRTCAVELVKQGYHVFGSVRSEADAESLREAAGEGLTPLRMDVTDDGDVLRCAAQVKEALGDSGRLVGIVNNAGIAVYGPLELLPLDTVRRQFEINVLGYLAVTKAFIPLLRRDAGRVVMIGSSSAFLTPPFLGPYASSKCALESISDALRRELAPWRIEVVVMQPGAVITPLWDKSIDQGDSWFDGVAEAERGLYEQGYGAMRKTFRDKSGRGIPVEKLARRVADVLAMKSPRTRYRMGTDSFGYLLMSKLPDKMVDAMLAMSLGHTRANVEKQSG
ncbi:MAG: SDR family oxidoreductase [Deltaproteobacteria bacterium]|nr:SDR family oxidoreductase [Deltaproteobacteria bacterium]MBW2444375.1 SDR family oxidoreductase [Deltaproteobacteria bacterium]